MAIETVNPKTGIKNVTLLDSDFIKNLFELYTVPGATGTTAGLLDAWQKFLETYLVNPRDLYSGLNVEGGTGDSYQVKVSATDLEGYLGDKIQTEVSSGVILTINGSSNQVINVALDIQESDSTSAISFLKDSKTLKKPVAGVGMTIDVTDDEITFNSTGDLGDITTQDITSQASESWNGVDEALDVWQDNAKTLIDGNSVAIDALATASMEYIYNGDLPLTTVEQQINFVTLVASSNTDIMDIDDATHQASLLVDARYSYYTYISVTNDTQQDHIMHLITRTSGGTLLTDREFTVDKEGYLLLRLEDTLVDITGTPLVFELYARADDSNALKITYLKSHISAGGDALVSSYLKKDGSNADEDFDIGDSNFSIDGTINPDGETTVFGGSVDTDKYYSIDSINSETFNTLGSNTGDYVLSKKHTHLGDVNTFRINEWLYRQAAGSDFSTVETFNGISIDSSYDTPTTSKTWWRRDPQIGKHSFGDAAITQLAIDYDGIEVYGGVSTDGGANYLKTTIITGTTDSSTTSTIFRNSYSAIVNKNIKSWVCKVQDSNTNWYQPLYQRASANDAYDIHYNDTIQAFILDYVGSNMQGRPFEITVTYTD